MMSPPKTAMLECNYDETVMLYTFVRAGDTLDLHTHAFMHRAMIPAGSRFEWFGKINRGEVEGPHVLTFPAGVPHGMRALNDGACCFVVMPSVDSFAPVVC